jgi:[acyl-carrier-protein] S-malonyltransferase
MLNAWLKAFPRTVQPLLDEIDDILSVPLTRVIENGPNAALNATENSQPAIMATSLLILRVLEQEFGFATMDRVDVTLGHSLGEFAALCAGGYMEFGPALRLVRRRAEVMARCTAIAQAESLANGDGIPTEVGMVAVICETEGRLRDLIDAIHDFLGHSSEGSRQDSAEDLPAVQQVLIANINSKTQLVLSGSIPRISELLTHLRQFGGHDPRHVRLNSDSPFHSPIMLPAQQEVRKLLTSPDPVTGKPLVTFPASLPCISNVTAKPFQSKEQLEDLVARSCVETVHWWESIKYLDREERVRRWIGIGPGKVGRNLVGKEVGMKGAVKGGGVWAITDPREIEEVLRGLEETECAGDD